MQRHRQLPPWKGVDLYTQSLQRAFSQPNSRAVSFTPLVYTSQELVYRLTISNEIILGRAFQGGSTLYVLEYTSKDNPSQSMQQYWLTRLQAARLIVPPSKGEITLN